MPQLWEDHGGNGMRIFQEGDYVRCQIVRMERGRMQYLADFKVHKDEYEELRQHMISNLEASPLDKLKE